MTPEEAWHHYYVDGADGVAKLSDEILSLRLDYCIEKFPGDRLSHSAKYTLPEARKRPALAPKLVVLRLKGLI